MVAVVDYAHAIQIAVALRNEPMLRILLARTIAVCSDWEVMLEADRLRAVEPNGE